MQNSLNTYMQHLTINIRKNNILFILYLLAIACPVHAIDFPDLPVLHIETVNGEIPTCTVVYAPEGCLGVSITDNAYVPGRMTVTLKGDTLYDSKEYVKDVSGMRIKRRGNSTGAYLNQHPYKIKLSKKYDLLERGDKTFRHKEWLLLSMYTWNPKMTYQESNILNVAGTIVSKIVRHDWTPEFEFVNVVLNGEYQGMYYLMESVDKGDHRVVLDDTGFLIEDDTFWWNEEVYFRTEQQQIQSAYTYKYPDDDDVTDSIQTVIQQYMNDFESALYDNGNVDNYIDYESFAKWLLIHDILGTYDVAGCNRFVYKYDYDKDNPFASKLKMGPAWDYDSAFKSDNWSAIHVSDTWFYYSALFRREDFVNTYLNLWKQVRPTILTELENRFDDFLNKYQYVFDESMKLHQTKYPGEGKATLVFQVDEMLQKINQRITTLDELMTQYGYSSHIGNIAAEQARLTDIVNMQGMSMKTADSRQLKPEIYIFRFSDGQNKKIRISE